MAEGTWWHEGGCCEAVVLAVWSGRQLVRNAEAQAAGHRPRGGISNRPSGGFLGTWGPDRSEPKVSTATATQCTCTHMHAHPYAHTTYTHVR